jgi:PKD repeat protein
LILLDNIPWGILHHGGGLIFDDVGNLYLGLGDLYSLYPAQALNSPLGKVFRIRPTEDGYEIPADNPFVGVPGALPEIYAYGVRNPYRMLRRPSDGAILLADVGEAMWEEVNTLQPGANFGWPIREGPCPLGEQQPCEPAPPAFVDPTVYYSHASGGTGVTGIAIYQGGRYPDVYHNALFFADVFGDFIQVTNPDTFTSPADIDGFATQSGAVVDMHYKDDALYILNVYAGTLTEIRYTGPENQLPIVSISVSDDLGNAPFTTTFYAEAVSPDPNLTYHWAFGDGTTVETTTPSIQHTYPQDGNYVAVVTVEDSTGQTSNSATVPVTVYSGELPTISLVNPAEPERTLFHGGDEWSFAALRQSGTGDLDPDAPYRWRIELQHNHHSHVVLPDLIAEEGTLPIPRSGHEGSTQIRYRLILTMTTLTGIEVEVTRELEPEVVQLVFDSKPRPQAGFYVTIDGVPRHMPYARTSIVGTEHHLNAPPLIFFHQWMYSFARWYSPTGEESPEPSYTLITPASDSPILAQYEYAGEAKILYLPVAGGG